MAAGPQSLHDRPARSGICPGAHLLASARPGHRAPPRPESPPSTRCFPMSKTCPACGTGNRPVARFCKKCATPLVPAGAVAQVVAASPRAARTVCSACRKPNRAAARYCRSCGQPMVPAALTPPLRQPTRPEPGLPTAPPGPVRPAQAGPRRRPMTLAAVLALLAVAALWWQRGSGPAPVAPAATPASAAPAAQAPAVAEPAAAMNPASAPPTQAASMPRSPAPPDVSTPQGQVPSTQAAPVETSGQASARTEPAAPQGAAKPAATPPLVARAVPAAPARQPATRPGPEAACVDSSALTRTLCISIQCFKSEFRQHPTCARLENEARERQKRDIDQGMVGG